MNTPRLNPLADDVTVINGSPQAGLHNETLENDTRASVEFLASLPENKSRRDRLVMTAATEICTGHDAVVADVENVSAAGDSAHAATYRITHAAWVMHDVLGADIEPAVIERRMQAARKASSVASKYTPVMGSYQRLHEASCAVKRGEPGAKENFYIASAEFVADLALAQHQVVYKASFKTTGVIAREIGMMRLARVCGYKCVGLVESQTYWTVNGIYAGTLDHIAILATERNLTADGWNDTTQAEVGEYLESTTNTTHLDGRLVHNNRILHCVTEELTRSDLWSLGGNLSSEAIGTLKTILTHQRIPEGADLSFIKSVESVRSCATN